MMSKNKKYSIFTLFKGLFLVLVGLSVVFPFLHILAVSLSKNIYVLQNEVSIIPKGFNLLTYIFILTNMDIYNSYFNTIKLVVLGTVVSLAVTTMGGYALSQKDFVFNKLFSILVIIPLFFGGGMIPDYLIVKQYGLVDSIWAIILPYTVNIVYLLIMRTFFTGISRDLFDAGKIDGLSDLGIFRYIALPLSKAALASIGLFYAMAYWNTWFAPMIYLNSPDKYPLQLLLRGMLLMGENSSNAFSTAGTALSDLSVKYTIIIVAIIPVLLLYPYAQKYFTKGIMIGSTKG